ncbi:MAG: GIDE domain-containing protein [Candidatus Zixiibacteriota bacterium]
MQYFVSLLFVVIGAAVFVHGFRIMRQYRLIRDIPQSKIRSMAMGLVEIHGNVKAEQMIKTPFSSTDCVYFKYEIKEYKRRTTTDSKGRTRTTHEWVVIAFGDRRIPFFAEDDTGSVYVDPTGAEFTVDVRKAFYQKAGVFSGISGLIDTLKNIGNFDRLPENMSELNLSPIDPGKKFSFGSRVGDRKYYEYFMSDKDNLFIMGTAANSPDAPNRVLIKKGENEPTYMISDKSEKEMLRSLRGKMILGFALGGGAFIAGVLVTLHFAGVI